MRGHIELTELRLQGIKPAYVHVFDIGEAPDGIYTAPENQLELGHQPEIYISPADTIERLDLRFLVGLVCMCQSNDLNRARSLYAALRAVPVYQITISDGQTFTHHEVFA